MIRNTLMIITGILLFCSCTSKDPEENVEPPISMKQEKEIKGLIEQLVFADGDASNEPILTPGMVISDSDGNTKSLPGSPGYHENPNDYDQRFKRCQDAFQRLSELKGTAIPFLVEHLDDKRQSINFRNHYLGNSVGDACYWNIYFRLQDRPRDYSRYGYQRKGRNGEYHPKPYWEGTPFDSEGGLKEWLEKNNELSYVQKQIKCLRWLLEKEKTIGACDPESYFVNILPLEIRILERRLEAGEKVEQKLKHLWEVKRKKLVEEIPSDLLPDKNQTER